jgi:acyl-CoA synthetase (AMP-forming)/AMP-acid ligase II
MQIESIIKPELAAQYRQQGFWTEKTLGEHFDEIVKKYSHKKAIVYKDQAITYSQLEEKVNKVAAGLIAAGLQKGDVLSVQLPNWPEFIYFFYAAIKSGIVFNPLHVPYRKREVEFILRFSNSKAMVIPDQYGRFDYPDMIQEIWPRLPNLKLVWVLGDKVPPQMSSATELLNKSTSSKESETMVASNLSDADSPILLMYTSGTESDPKGVVHSHNSVGCMGGTITKGLGMSSEDVIFTPSPFSHAMGILLGPWASVYWGAQIVIQEAFDSEEILRFIQDHKITFFAGTPSHIVAILQVPNFSQYQLSSLRTFFTGGASCPVEIVREATNQFGCQLSCLYGMTEGVTTYTRLDDTPETASKTVGRPGPGSEIKIFDEDGKEVPDGITGEIVARGPSLFLSYYKNPQATQDTRSADGWFFTGDLGYIDQEGNLRIVGRKKDMIIRGGKNIYPAEIEELIYTHPKIVEAALVGVPDHRLGERSCLFVVLKSDEEMTLEEVVDYLKEKGIAIYKLPERLEVRKDLPMTPSKKIWKRFLRDEIIRDLENEAPSA